MILGAAKQSSRCSFGDLGLSKTKTGVVSFFIPGDQEHLCRLYILYDEIFFQTLGSEFSQCFSAFYLMESPCHKVYDFCLSNDLCLMRSVFAREHFDSVFKMYVIKWFKFLISVRNVIYYGFCILTTRWHQN